MASTKSTSALPKEKSNSSVKTVASNGTQNHDACIQLLKSKIELVENSLPKYDKFDSYEISSYEGMSFPETIRGLNRQKIEMVKAKTECCSMYSNLTSVHNTLIDEYKNTERSSEFTKRLDKLENERNITGLISSLESIEATLTGLILEVDMTIACERDLQEMTQGNMTRNQPETIDKKSSGIKLTDVEVPTFDGTGESFIEFLSSYDQLVHKNDNLSEIEKGIRLKQCLKGRAAQCIKGIPVTSENYSIMYAKLKRKFENASVNKHAIVEKLENLSESGKTTDDCMNTLSEIEVILNQLECAKMSITDSTNLLFHRLILSKFPQYIVKKIVERTKEDDFTVEKLMIALENAIFNENFTQKVFSRKTNKNESESTYQAKSKKTTGGRCIFCPIQNHQSERCRKPVEEKIEILKKKRACWKCFELDHTSLECKREACTSCRGNHNVSVCKRQTPGANVPYNNNNNYVHNDENGRNNANSNVRGNFYQRESNYTPTSKNLNSNEQRNTSFNAHHVAENEEHLEQHHMNDNDLQTYHTSVVQRYTQNLPTLMTCRVEVFSPKKNQFVPATILLDSGSQFTLVDQKFSETLGVREEGKRTLTVNGINPGSSSFISKMLRLNLKLPCNKQISLTGLTKPFISKGFKSAKLNENDLKFIEASKISLVNSLVEGKMIKPDILIGADQYNKVVENAAATVLPSGLHIAKTVFGNCVFGIETNPPVEKSQTIVMHSCIESVENEIEPNEMFKQMYELESIGIPHEGSPSMEKVVKFYNEFKNNISFEGEKVTVPFPLKEDISKLGSNFNLAYKQLDSLRSKLDLNDEMKNHYVRKLAEYEQDGIIEIVTEENEISHKVADYYIPHHGVWNPEKKEKPLRIVFGAQSKQRGYISLNEAIETGETFVNKIADIIMASRKTKYIISCDIQGAFTQIRMIPEHQDLCRFLWIKDPEKKLNRDNLLIYRFKRLPFGVTASPAILNMSITAFLEKENSELGKEILDHIYVDNVLLQANEIEAVKRKIKESKNLLNKISFNLREYVTNNAEINRSIPENDKGKTGKTKILGVLYDTDSDNYTAKILVKEDSIITKRVVLKQLHTIFDPIGLLTPAIVMLRFTMRQIFQRTKHWNDQPPQELVEKWVTLINQFNNAEVCIPRYIGKEHERAKNQILWVFTDASLIASAACAYVQDSNSKIVSKIITGKAKLTPTTRTPLEDTIPKFEFSSILLGLEMAKKVIENLELQSCELRIVNDSTSALTWIGYSKTLRRSCNLIREKVRRAVKEIMANFEVTTRFFHCPGEKNVADIATRGWCPHSLENCEWVNGPECLKKDIPDVVFTEFFLDKIEVGVDEQLVVEEINQLNVLDQTNEKSGFNLTHFETGTRAKWVIAKLLNGLKRWLNRARENLGKQSNESSCTIGRMSGNNVPNIRDLQLTERVIIMEEQKTVNIDALRERYKQKIIFTDENDIIRCDSRLMNADLPRDTKQPIFLPAKSEWLKLIIKELHQENCHCGKTQLLMFLRQNFWIPRPSKVINFIIKQCIPCRIEHCLPFKAPTMPSIPIDRVVRTSPFSHTGIDYMGPFELKNNDNVHVCLFTCLVTRCIHLEVAKSLSGGDFLKCFTRFVSRRGKPKIIRSDNGTNFVLGWKLIKKLNENPLQFCTKNNIEWKFNPPSSPWMGGCWEICVKLVKQAFYKTVGRNKLTEDDFHTIMVKIEGIVNSRPLTTVGETSSQPLKPCDLLIPRIELILPDFNENLDDPEYEIDSCASETAARKVMFKIEKLTDVFWERFKTEYLPKLRDSQKYNIRQGRCAGKREPEIGEMVIIEEDFLPKHKWNLAKIINTVKGKDGFIRTAVIEVEGKQLVRPIIKLYPLEIKTIITEKGISDNNEMDSSMVINKVDTAANESGKHRKAKLLAIERTRTSLESATGSDQTDTQC